MSAFGIFVTVLTIVYVIYYAAMVGLDVAKMKKDGKTSVEQISTSDMLDDDEDENQPIFIDEEEHVGDVTEESEEKIQPEQNNQQIQAQQDNPVEENQPVTEEKRVVNPNIAIKDTTIERNTPMTAEGVYTSEQFYSIVVSEGTMNDRIIKKEPVIEGGY